MQIINKIRLIDGSEHNSKEMASRHLFNVLSSGTDLELFQNLSNKSALKIREFFIENSAQIEKTMQIVRELKEVEKLKII